jgi:hypothetical protein
MFQEHEVNFIGLLTPFIIKAFKFGTRGIIGQIGEQYMIKYLSKILSKHLQEPIMKGLAYMIITLIKENWNIISKFTKPQEIAKYIMNKIFKGTGDLIFQNN